ncbi:MAG: hypothetical protein WC005_10485 [Candidatus Nanopelagicales bacterium]
MSDVIQHFLLVYNRATGTLEQERPFGTDAEAALAAYAEAESVFRESPHMQIVLIGSDSIETVRITHANYFEPAAAESKYFAGL